MVTWSRRARRAHGSPGLGRWVARLFCVVFALVGALPLGAAALARTERVRTWASDETARVLEELLGIRASYEVEVRVFPLQLSLENVLVESSDGGDPALSVERMSVTPRIFSLLAGRLDVGDIELEQPEARVVLRDGKIANVNYRLPETRGDSPKLERAPFTSLAITEARAQLDIDGILVDTGPIDVDVFAERGPAFEVAVRAGRSTAFRRRLVELSGKYAGPPAEAVDEDVLCQLDLRARVDEGGVLVRRLSLLGYADENAAPDTLSTCAVDAGDDDPGRVAVRLSQVRMVLSDGEPSVVDGHVVARAPVSLARRVGAGHFSGWVGFAGNVHYDTKQELPDLRGKVRGAGIALGPYRFAEQFEGDVEIQADVVRLPALDVRYGRAALAKLTDVELRPFEEGLPLSLGKMEATGLRFQDFMEYIDVTQNTIVQWDLDKTVVSKFTGRLDPVRLDGDLYAETRNFEVFDRAYHLKDRKHMIGVKQATLRGRFGVRPDAILFSSTRAQFGHSKIDTSVAVGFDNTIRLSIGDKSVIDLADASPLVDIPMSGLVTLGAQMDGLASEAVLTSNLSIQNLVFAGYPFGDVTSAKARFQPLQLLVTELTGTKGTSQFRVPSALLDFESDATLVVDAAVESDNLDTRDFFHMWHFDTDPRFASIKGKNRVRAKVHYDMGGKRDQCKTGHLRVDGQLTASSLELYDERYDTGRAEFDFRWFDIDAGSSGMDVNVPSLALEKGEGTLLGSLHVTDGGVVHAQLVGTKIPLSRIQSFGELGQRVSAEASAVAEVSGTLDEMAAEVSVQVSKARIGRATLPGSSLAVRLAPTRRTEVTTEKTRCGHPASRPFDPEQYARDAADGVFHVSGELFGGQIKLHDVAVTRQRSKVVSGKIGVHDLDLGAMAELSPLLALSDQRLDGRLRAEVDIAHLPVEHPERGRARLSIERLRFGRAGYEITAASGTNLSIEKGLLSVPALSLVVKMPSGQEGRFDATGKIAGLGARPTVDMTLRLKPTDLSGFSPLVPRAERLNGTLSGAVTLSGPLSSPRHNGRFTLQNGEFIFRGSPVSLTDVEVTLGIEPDQINLVEARASSGGGTITARGSVPIRRMSLGEARGLITARDIHVQPAPGVKLALDADLEAIWKPESAKVDDERSLPRITGDVNLRSFAFTRKVTMNADIASLAKRGKVTQIETYDREKDAVEFDIRVRSAEPLSIENDLIDAKLGVQDPGLEFVGTNQRFGMRGQLAVVKGGRIRLRRNEFEITTGHVQFDDSQRIAPKVDVTAVTDYTRYSDAAGTADPSVGSTAGGRWRITMRAHGDSENLRIDLSSEPKLGQDDIFLLLTLGLTRAELDRAQSASAGQSVALEALGRLTGADEAVTKTIPVIDEFRFGSAYSSRTGRTEPTVTIGKRLSQRIRAYVTSGLTESREIRSNLQVSLSNRISVEGSYDNVNDISSSALGNLGANVRWRLEFE